MRLCRFLLDGRTRVGFYDERGVVPISVATEASGRGPDREPIDDLLRHLPPEGPDRIGTKELYDWAVGPSAPEWSAMAVPWDRIRLLVPVPRPAKLLLLAGNYADHIAERGGVAAERDQTFPYVFWKPPTTTLTNPGDPIVIPRSSPDHVDWECELAVVIGRTCRDIDESEAIQYVAGYTVVNDISDRKFTPNPSRKPRERDKFFDWLHGKWHDTFCPMGPCLLSAEGADPGSMAVELRVNGEVKQSSTTAKMIFPVGAVIAFLSRFVTLEPGDIISTGTPSGVGSATGTYLKPGDVVRASVGGIGTLENPVVAADPG